MRIAVGQLNPTVGDIRGNVERIAGALESVAPEADLLVLPELVITGYPPRDLLATHGFLDRVARGLARLVEVSTGFPETGLLVGAPTPASTESGRSLHNSALLIQGGRTLAARHKSLLPTYDVFDETRYFERGADIDVVRFKGVSLGITVCEDAWNAPGLWQGRPLYDFEPVGELARRGAELFLNLSALPFCAGTQELRHQLLRTHAVRHGVPFLLVNQVGGNDELVFDGRSMYVDAHGDLLRALPAFAECLEVIDTSAPGEARPWPARGRIESIHDALVLGLRDYARKCGFERAVLGLSGGVDSAVACCLAARALGPEKVKAVAMPSAHSAEESTSSARRLAQNLGVEFLVIPISSVYGEYARVFCDALGASGESGIAFENIQARIRGNLLMSISNLHGHLVLSTGNRSEMSVGYCTLYGDMCGGLAVIGDVPKTTVYELARLINADGEVIPRWIVERAPSAELRPGQTDQETLPPYDVLDGILLAYVEEGKSAEEITDMGFDRDTVKWVIGAVRRSEHKRRQAAPALRVTSKAFGVGRRVPIATSGEV